MKRGEVWLVALDPVIGPEIKKTGPAVIISSDLVGILPLKMIIPFTDWKDHSASAPWMVRVDPDDGNGLSKTSAADGLLIRSVPQKRPVKRLGALSSIQIAHIVQAVVNVLQR